MNELSRIEIAAQLLEELNALCIESDQRSKMEIIYNFLLGDEATSSFDNLFCTNHGIEQKLLDVYKKDSWLLVLLDAYEYLIASSETKELSEIQQSFLTKLDSIEFNFTNLYSFFTSKDNKEEIVIGIESYYEYWQKGNEFVKKCRDYCFDNQTEFRNKLTSYISNIEAMDLMATIFDDLDAKYQKEINMAIVGEEESIEFEDPDMDYDELESEEEFPEDFDEDEYSAAVDEMFDDNEEEVEKIMERFKIELHSKILDFLEDYLDDKFACDEFLGFFMSYVYMIILNNQKNGKLFKEEEQLLKVLSLEDFSPALVIETFYENPDYVFAALDSFCRFYYKMDCDILTLRDDVSTSIERKRINEMDEHFPLGKRIDRYKLINNPYYEIYDMLYMKFKLDYPDDYAIRLFNSLTTIDYDPIFYEFDLDEDINYHRLMMIRYFSRKYVEATSVRDMASIPSKEYETFEKLLSEEFNPQTLIGIFAKYGITILKGYNYLLDKTISQEKAIVKRIYDAGYGNGLFKIDPGMISDSLYYRALNDTPLYKYVEENGIEKTVKFLIELSKTDYEQYEDYMKEVFASLYCSFEDNQKLDSVENTVKLVIDSSKYSLEGCFKAIISDELLMYQLLAKYYDIENTDDYPTPIEERIVAQPKVKQKLYPLNDEDI